MLQEIGSRRALHQVWKWAFKSLCIFERLGLLTTRIIIMMIIIVITLRGSPELETLQSNRDWHFEYFCL